MDDAATQTIQAKFLDLRPVLDERARRLWAAARAYEGYRREAAKIGKDLEVELLRTVSGTSSQTPTATFFTMSPTFFRRSESDSISTGS